MRPSVKEENPFQGRILTERTLARNESFRIVEDRDPVALGHLLLFTIEQIPSLADLPEGALGNFLNDEFSSLFPGERFVMVEKGRSRSCTSFGHVVHAHAHLVPFKNCSETLTFPENAKSAASLNDAFQLLKDSDEYLLMGIVGEGFRIVEPLVNSPKRLARLVISGNAPANLSGVSGEWNRSILIR